MNILHAFFGWSFFIMFPAAGLEEETGAQVGQGLCEFLFVRDIT